jgi:glycosyltransferase involved in cell wall biosynthesis
MNRPKVSIVMTYFQRQPQLNKTLQSFFQYDPKEFNVIIIDDKSDNDIILPNLPFEVKIIKITDKKWVNMEPAYNTGILEALKYNPEIIILQNAENYHVGNVLDYAKTITNDDYISFGCYSLDEKTTMSDHDILKVIESNNKGAIENGQNAWYNHPEFRPVGYDFCSAITAKNLIKLNGYDERFSSGIAYGDNDLLSRIKKLKLNIEITKFPFVVHQWHYTNRQHPDCTNLVKRNSDLFAELSQLPHIKAEHVYTQNL